MNPDLLSDGLPPTYTPGGTLTLQNLRVLRKHSGELGWAGRRVALSGSSWLVAKWLMLLDGVASSLLFIPRDTAPELAAAFIETGAIDILLSEGQTIPGVPVVHDKEVLGPLPAAPSKEHGPRLAAQAETQWLFTTSGTTSSPKVVEHTLKSLMAAVSHKNRAQTLKWGLLYDICRFAGIQVAIQAWHGGQGLVIPSDARDIPATLELFRATGCNALSATPSIWRQILMCPAAKELPLRQITLGGEIADRVILSALRSEFPQAHLTHVYASTEAGVGFAVHDGVPGFPAEWLDGEKLKMNAEGSLLVKGAGAASRYAGSNGLIYDSEGWVDTGDLIEVQNGRAYFRGRANGAINVGGNKVYPEEVESVIREIGGVEDVHVFGRSNPFTGQLVEALVVPRAEQENQALIKSITASCRARLPAFKVPARIRVVSELQLSGGGKLLRRPQ